MAARPRRTRSRRSCSPRAATTRSTAQKLAVDRESMPLAGHSAVIVRRHPGNLEKAIGWIFADGRCRAARPRPQAPALRQVLVPRLRGRRAGERAEGAVDGDRLAAARRPAPERRASGRGRARWRSPRGRRSPSCRPSSRRRRSWTTSRGSAAPEREGRGVGTKGLDARGRVRRRGLQGDGPAAGRRQRDVLPVVPVAEVALGRGRDAAQRDRRPARARRPSGRASRPS